MKIHTKTCSSLFCFLIFGLTLFNLFTPDKSFSENENRYLKTLPVFSRSALWSGSYTAGLDEYVIDQFFRRDGWVGLKTLAERGMQHKSSGGVYFADDDYLIEMFDTVDLTRYQRNLGYVAEFARRAQEEYGITVKTMLVPTASSILADKLPAYAPEVDQAALLAKAKQTLPAFTDVTGALSLRMQEYLFYRTDHHWTSLGAFCAYNAYLEDLGLARRSADDYKIEILSEDFYGTTWSKASLYSVLPDTLEGWTPKDTTVLSVENADGVSNDIYVRSFLDVKDKYSVYFGENQPLVRIKTDVQNGRKLMLIKDSYANAFAQFALADFEEVILLDPRFFRTSCLDYVGENGITDILVLYNLKGFSGDASVYFLTA